MPITDSKRGPRMVPWTTPALKVLDGVECVEGAPCVTRSQKPGICLPDLNYYWNRIRDRAGLEGVRIHDLRHTHAPRAMALGETLPVMGSLRNLMLGCGGGRATAAMATMSTMSLTARAPLC